MLDHRPISMMEKIGTPARYIAIAAPDGSDLPPFDSEFRLSDSNDAVYEKVNDHV